MHEFDARTYMDQLLRNREARLAHWEDSKIAVPSGRLRFCTSLPRSSDGRSIVATANASLRRVSLLLALSWFAAALGAMTSPTSAATWQEEHANQNEREAHDQDAQAIRDKMDAGHALQDGEPHGQGESEDQRRVDVQGDSAAHDHSDHNTGAPRFVRWLGEFHPPATDLPIGLLLSAALAEVLLIVTKREFFRNAVTYCVWIAAIGAVSTVTLGWFNGGFTLVDEDWIQTTHRWLGTSTAITTICTLALLMRTARATSIRRPRLAFRIALFSAAGLVATTGFFGGALVYGLDHYAW